MAVGAIWWASAAFPARAQPSLEYAVKATFLYKFAAFIEWPSGAFSSPQAPLAICVLGNEAFASLVDEAVKDQHVGERPFVVYSLREVDRNAGCHILYIGATAAQTVMAALGAVRGAPVLTVTDAAGTSSGKGIIHFIVQDNRVRFEIDNQSAGENQLAISSRLLGLAVSVKPRI